MVGADITGIEIIDPASSDKASFYADTLYELRKAKGVTPEDAVKLVADPMYFGIMMIKCGDADGLVSGCRSHNRRHAPSRFADNQDKARDEGRIFKLPHGLP